MKKAIALALALLMLLALSACGVKDKIQDAAENAVNDALNGGGSDNGDKTGYNGGGEYKGHPILSDYASADSAPDVLHRFGLTDDVVIPPEALGITRYLEDPYGDPFVRTEYGFEVPDEPTTDEFKDYSRGIYEALSGLSDDGKLYLWYGGDYTTEEDDGYMVVESFGDIIGGALFLTWHNYSMKYDGRLWSVSVSADESAAPYSHWELQLDITTALTDDFSPIVEGEHTPEAEPFADSLIPEAEVVGKTVTGERLVIRDNMTKAGADYNFYAERVYLVYTFDADGTENGFYQYYFYDNEASYEKGLEKNLTDDLWEQPPYIASKLSLYICEGGKPFFTHFDSYEEAYTDFEQRGEEFYTIIK